MQKFEAVEPIYLSTFGTLANYRSIEPMFGEKREDQQKFKKKMNENAKTEN